MPPLRRIGKAGGFSFRRMSDHPANVFQETCIDVQHKKRGRPRLRDEHRSHSFEIAQVQHPGVTSSPSSPTAFGPTYKSGTHRILKSQQDSSRHSLDRRLSLTPREDTLGNGSGYFDQHRPPMSNVLPPISPPIFNATAFLTPDLLVAKSTDGMRELCGYSASDLDGVKSLFDIVLSTDIDRLEHLVDRFREEIQEREPARWSATPPIQTIEAVNENNIYPATQGARTYAETLHLCRADGSNYLKIRIRAHLAFTSVYFVVMVFSLTNEMPPPLQLNSAGYSSGFHKMHSTTPGSTPTIQSPTFMPSHHLQTAAPSGPQSPYSHPGLPMTLESRPRIMQQESTYPPLAPYGAQSPVSATFYRPPMSPAAPGFGSPGTQPRAPHQNDLQLPPLKTLPAFGGIENRMRGTGTEEPRRIDLPRRERIGVREMLE